jgi:hypothetical protein
MLLFMKIIYNLGPEIVCGVMVAQKSVS